MRPVKLILRCFAEQVDGKWQAFSLDFDLAVQGETFAEVRQKLDYMMRDYVRDALVGEDRQYAEQLLTRRAPWHLWVRYYTYWVFRHIGRLRDGIRRTYNTALPMQPQC